jgi:hypothetical protein
VTQQNPSAPTCALIAEPSDLDVAIGVAQLLLDSDSTHALREALRILLRALAAETVDPGFAAEFPRIAAHLAAERGEGQ